MKPYVLIGHSYGTIVTIEAYVKLQQLGYNNCKLILIDGSPVMMKAMCQKQLVSEDDVNIQMTLLGGLLSQIIPLPDLLKHKARVHSPNTINVQPFILLIFISSFVYRKNWKNVNRTRKEFGIY